MWQHNANEVDCLRKGEMIFKRIFFASIEMLLNKCSKISFFIIFLEKNEQFILFMPSIGCV